MLQLCGHRAVDCKSKRKCQHCKGLHRSSICEKTDIQATLLKTVLEESCVVHPAVLVKVNGITCRAMLDTCAGSSYASSMLLERLKKKPDRKEYRKIEMMLHTTTRRAEIFKIEVSSLDDRYKINTEASKLIDLHFFHFQILTLKR